MSPRNRDAQISEALSCAAGGGGHPRPRKLGGGGGCARRRCPLPTRRGTAHKPWGVRAGRQVPLPRPLSVCSSGGRPWGDTTAPAPESEVPSRRLQSRPCFLSGGFLVPSSARSPLGCFNQRPASSYRFIDISEIVQSRFRSSRCGATGRPRPWSAGAQVQSWLAERVKDLVLPRLQRGSQVLLRSHPWPGNCVCDVGWPKRRRKKKKDLITGAAYMPSPGRFFAATLGIWIGPSLGLGSSPERSLFPAVRLLLFCFFF